MKISLSCWINTKSGLISPVLRFHRSSVLCLLRPDFTCGYQKYGYSAWVCQLRDRMDVGVKGVCTCKCCASMISVVFWWPFFFRLPAFLLPVTACQWCYRVTTEADAVIQWDLSCQTLRKKYSHNTFECIGVWFLWQISRDAIFLQGWPLSTRGHKQCTRVSTSCMWKMGSCGEVSGKTADCCSGAIKSRLVDVFPCA